MALMGDTGNGATLTFGTSSLTLAITQIQIGEITIDMLDVSTLATTDFEELIPTDLKKIGECSARFVFSTAANAPAPGAAAETITATLPLRTGEGTAANLAGTGNITGFKLPDLQNGVVQEGMVKWRYNGDTGPTYTKSVAA